MTQAMPTRTPPISTTNFGPKRSTNHPSTGTSQVSVNTKMLNATWIAARPHWYLASIGKTNSVQPYCRLAIITMQTMPKASCSQRNNEGRAAAAPASTGMCFSLQAFLTAVLHHRFRRPPRIGVGLPRAMNLKQRLYRLISSNFRMAVYVNGSIINNERLTQNSNFRLTKRDVTALACGWLAVGSLAGAALADDRPAPSAGEPPAIVETGHSITLGGHSVDYRAIAETIGLTDQKGEPSASA